MRREHHGVSHRGPANVLDAGNDVPDFTRLEAVFGRGLGREAAHVVYLMRAAHRLHHDPIAAADAAMHHTDQRHDAQVVIKPGVDDESLQRSRAITLGGRNAFDQLFEQIGYALPRSLELVLGPPPAGHRYVRVATDILLIAIGTGIVVDALEDIAR